MGLSLPLGIITTLCSLREIISDRHSHLNTNINTLLMNLCKIYTHTYIHSNINIHLDTNMNANNIRDQTRYKTLNNQNKNVFVCHFKGLYIYYKTIKSIFT